MKILLQKCEWTKLGVLGPFDNNSKYHEFTKISKSKILFYNKILIIKIRTTKQTTPKSNI